MYLSDKFTPEEYENLNAKMTSLGAVILSDNDEGRTYAIQGKQALIVTIETDARSVVQLGTRIIQGGRLLNHTNFWDMEPSEIVNKIEIILRGLSN